MVKGWKHYILSLTSSAPEGPKITHDSEEIVSHILVYYKQLFSTQVRDIHDYNPIKLIVPSFVTSIDNEK